MDKKIKRDKIEDIKFPILARIFYPFALLGIYSEIYYDLMKGYYLALFPFLLKNSKILLRAKKELRQRLKQPLSSKQYENLISQAKKYHKQLILSKLSEEILKLKPKSSLLRL